MQSTPILHIRDKRLFLPTFLPDATLGYVRAVDSRDLEDVKIQGLVMNTFHLMQKPGSSTIQSFNGLHHFSDWHKVIITDSGGFQAYSLIHQSENFGTLTDRGILFRPEGKGRKFLLTPEKASSCKSATGVMLSSVWMIAPMWMPPGNNRSSPLNARWIGQSAVSRNTLTNLINAGSKNPTAP
jgi:tRNA-guanine family transglycosylase